MYLYHYFDKSVGPFRSLSELTPNEAQKILPKIKSQTHEKEYIDSRISYEKSIHEIFLEMGGKAELEKPHYMTLNKSEWLYNLFENPAYIIIPVEEFDKKTLSFTYGDICPTFNPKTDNDKEYNGKLYFYYDILKIINRFGMPQDLKDSELSETPHYIEAQIWSDEIINKYKDTTYWRS